MFNPGPILIGCEESQTICREFRNNGFDAYSCDLQETRGDPKYHFKDDVIKIIPTNKWKLIILHPDCTYLAVSGNRWYGRQSENHHKRIDAIKWTVELWNLAKLHSEKVALENPISVIFQYLNAPICYVQPYEHGSPEIKKTCFALHNLPALKPSNMVAGRKESCFYMAPSPTRKRDRSKTFDGIAKAIVKQWGPLIT